MEKSNEIGSLAKAMGLFRSKVEQPVKDANNPFFKSKYVTLEGVIKSVDAAIIDTGLTWYQEPVSDNNKIGVATHIFHESGEWLAFEPFYVTPTKVDPQAQGSALTYAKRYSLAAAFGISSDIDDDGNGASNNDKPNGNTQYETTGKISPKQIGLVKKLFNQYATLTKADVLKVSEFALNHNKISSLENASSSQASALIKYMQEQIAKKQDDGQ
ncbi:ERF family protein [Carnobacterium maltaromaticum]|uniref:ERF family protein n=1 Tax=Carnobacterium maltaromaticum TaxID=2751 RepID=UPI0039BEB35C